jgi:hypothetical protein
MSFKDILMEIKGKISFLIERAKNYEIYYRRM